MAGTPPEPDLSITTRATPRGSVVAVAGELDLSNVDRLGEAARAALAEGAVVIDLADVPFMDSSGVRLLDALLREAAAAGRALTVRPELQPRVRQVLEMTGLLAELPFDEHGASPP
jgi:anti-sigma B factor antagonist